MFLENTIDHTQRRGWIEVIAGSMFSGKTEELIRRLKRARIAQQHVEIFKPVLDNRYSERDVVSHDANSIPSTPVKNPEKILALQHKLEVVGIDEAQFFDNSLINVCNILAFNGVRVIVAGLDMNFKGEPFGIMPQLLATAEYVTKVHAICMRCGNLAHYSHRKSGDEAEIVLGEKDIYEPLCRNCFREQIEKQNLSKKEYKLVFDETLGK